MGKSSALEACSVLFNKLQVVFLGAAIIVAVVSLNLALQGSTGSWFPFGATLLFAAYICVEGWSRRHH